MSVFLYWLFGSAAAAAILIYFWPYDHSSGSLMFYGVLVAGIVLGFIHRALVQRRAGSPKRAAHTANDV